MGQQCCCQRAPAPHKRDQTQILLKAGLADFMEATDEAWGDGTPEPVGGRAKQHRERSRRELVKALQKTFDSYDADGSGSLSQVEVTRLIGHFIKTQQSVAADHIRVLMAWIGRELLKGHPPSWAGDWIASFQDSAQAELLELAKSKLSEREDKVETLAAAFFAQVDVDKSGSINKLEFVINFMSASELVLDFYALVVDAWCRHLSDSASADWNPSDVIDWQDRLGALQIRDEEADARARERAEADARKREEEETRIAQQQKAMERAKTSLRRGMSVAEAEARRHQAEAHRDRDDD